MTTLTDGDIKSLGRTMIQPFYRDLVQPVSYECTLARTFLSARRSSEPIDPMNLSPEIWSVSETDKFVLQRGEFVLASTVERITLPDDILAHVHGKSTLGRCALLVHATAGLVDPGWDGTITLELRNIGPRPILLSTGMPICQLMFERLDRPVDRPYGSPGLGSHYQGQTTTRPGESLC